MGPSRRTIEAACELLSAGASGLHMHIAMHSLDVSDEAFKLAEQAYLEAPCPRWMVVRPMQQDSYEDWCANAECLLREGWLPRAIAKLKEPTP